MKDEVKVIIGGVIAVVGLIGGFFVYKTCIKNDDVAEIPQITEKTDDKLDE